MLSLRPFLLTATLALALATTTATCAQGLGGLLDQAKSKANQLKSQTNKVGTQASAAATQTDQGDTGLPPRLPSPDELTPENNLSSALTILHNRRPYDDYEYGTPDVQDHQYRKMRFKWKNPVEFTFDPSFAEYATKQRRWLFNIAANVCETLEWMSNSENEDMRYKRQKALKIKEWHFTTTKELPNRKQSDFYAGTQGYIMSFDPATGVLTCAASTPINHLTNFRGEDIAGFIMDNVK